MNFSRQIILTLCQQHGPELSLPLGIDGPSLMYAVACTESTCGFNCTPRHEPAYDHGGKLGDTEVMKPLLAKYGQRAACSYGPWQVMFPSAAQYTPDELESDPDKNARAFVHYINWWVIKVRGAKTLKDIAETYNSGRFLPDDQQSAFVLRYAATVAQHYAESPFLHGGAR